MATSILLTFALYFGFGLLIALFLCFSGRRGLERLDHAAHGASLSVRLLLVPGLSALWPLFLFRWLRTPSAEART